MMPRDTALAGVAELLRWPGGFRFFSEALRP